jgi:hypothetical protein
MIPTIRFWTNGPAQADGGPVFVSVTDFKLARVQDLVRATNQGMRLRRVWPSLPGAIGLWLWSKPLSKRSGSVSVWRSEEDLLNFVRWPRHVEIMRRYRSAGDLTSATWWADHFDASAIWAAAQRRLGGDDPELAHTGASAGR